MSDVTIWQSRLTVIAKLDKAAEAERAEALENARCENYDRNEDFALESRV